MVANVVVGTAVVGANVVVGTVVVAFVVVVGAAVVVRAVVVGAAVVGAAVVARVVVVVASQHLLPSSCVHVKFSQVAVSDVFSAKPAVTSVQLIAESASLHKPSQQTSASKWLHGTWAQSLSGEVVNAETLSHVMVALASTQ